MATRILTCMFIFGWLAYQLQGAGEGFATITAGTIALTINWLWRTEEHTHQARTHRENVLRDEQLRLDIQELYIRREGDSPQPQRQEHHAQAF